MKKQRMILTCLATPMSKQPLCKWRETWPLQSTLFSRNIHPCSLRAQGSIATHSDYGQVSLEPLPLQPQGLSSRLQNAISVVSQTPLCFKFMLMRTSQIEVKSVQLILLILFKSANGVIYLMSQSPRHTHYDTN